MSGTAQAWGWVNPDGKFAAEMKRQNDLARKEFSVVDGLLVRNQFRGPLSNKHYCGVGPDGEDLLLSVSQIAKRCQVGVQAVYGRIRRGVSGEALLDMHRHRKAA